MKTEFREINIGLTEEEWAYVESRANRNRVEPNHVLSAIASLAIAERLAYENPLPSVAAPIPQPPSASAARSAYVPPSSSVLRTIATAAVAVVVFSFTCLEILLAGRPL